MVGFLLGHKLTLSSLHKRGRSVLWISIGEVVGATMLVALSLFVLAVEPVLILLLAGIAPASDPAALIDVVKKGAKGKFTDIILGIVAIDDVWGLLIFSFMLAAANAVSGQGGTAEAILFGLVEISGSVLLGMALGLPMAYLTGRIRPGELTQAEALGLVILCAGAATRMDLSPILAAMVMGTTVASLAFHHERPFNEIDGIEWPFMILFFLLAGASLHLDKLLAGWIGLVYILARVGGLYSGARIAGRLADAEPTIQRWIGLCLFPQAGVALGMALLAAQRFPEMKDVILPVVIGSTVIFEVVGPVITRRVLKHVQSIKPTLIDGGATD